MIFPGFPKKDSAGCRFVTKMLVQLNRLKFNLLILRPISPDVPDVNNEMSTGLKFMRVRRKKKTEFITKKEKIKI